jgi:alpha-glucosidase
MAYTWFTRPVWCWLRGEDSEVGMLGFPAAPPRLDGPAVVASMRELAGGIPWSAFTASMTLLDSHDSARFASVACDVERQIVGVALLMTYPGTPMVFAGDEIGLDGVTSDAARRPFPWGDERLSDGEGVSDLLRAYRRLIGIRRMSDALQRGGLRWASVGDDSLTFLRESATETVIVHVARAAHAPVRLPAAQLGLRGGGEVEVLFGTAPAVDGETAELPGDGPGAHIWRIATTSQRGVSS